MLALIEEFCNKWVCTVIDSTFGVYGAEKYGMNEATFRYVLLSLFMTIVLWMPSKEVSMLFNRSSFMGSSWTSSSWIWSPLWWLVALLIVCCRLGGHCLVIGVVTCILAPNVAIACLGACLLSVGFGFTSPCGSSIISVSSLKSASFSLDRE